jgi:NADPH-dependent glutamate synthase beta subunit-like oxidoreductase
MSINNTMLSRVAKWKRLRDQAREGKRVLVIGAGNVGRDAATEAHRLGAEEILLIDIQEPLSFDKEREEANGPVPSSAGLASARP